MVRHAARRFPPLALALALPWAPSASLAHGIDPGNDLYRCQPGTYFDFASQPIPADFFGPGSQPFDGIVHLTGQPQPYAPCPFDPPADSIILRPLPCDPPDVVPIELVQLSLVSVSPIVVHYESGLEQSWNVRVTLAPIPVPPSAMTIRHESVNGGTFDAQIFVYPHFTFESPDSGDTLTYDPIGPFPVVAAGVPWEHVEPPDGSCRSNFCANPAGDTVFSGSLGQLVLGAICPSAAVGAGEGPSASTWGRVKSSYR